MIFNWSNLRGALRYLFQSTYYLQALPALMLVCFWFLGERGLLACAIGGPLLNLLANRQRATPRDPITGLAHADGFEARCDLLLNEATQSDKTTAVLSIALDDYASILRDTPRSAAETTLRQVAERLSSALREGDQIAHLGAGRFRVCLNPTVRCDLETVIQIANRLQVALSEPFVILGNREFLSASIGFSLMTQVSPASGIEMISAAERALGQAVQAGGGAIRAYDRDMPAQPDVPDIRTAELEDAFETGQITAWFQPQISTDTGRVSGVEALARWVSPEHGVLAPADFLEAIETAGFLPRLADTILYNALSGLRRFDRAGLDIPMVAVNFSAEELGDAQLVEKIRWELDRHDLSPERLCVEVLESVVARQRKNDIISHNLRALAELGCRIDLDDFGTGHASIASIRRFSIQRIKIDRSFVVHVDEDEQQREMIAAILTMAEQLKLETLAEGVETIAEHALLAQLGCDAVQGYVIARPMPADDVPKWVRNHNGKLASAPRIGWRTG